jgi:membrane-associated protein
MNPLDHFPTLPTGPLLYLVLAAVVVGSSTPMVSVVLAAEPVLMAVVVLTRPDYLALSTLLALTVGAAATGDVLTYGLGLWFAPKLLRLKVVRRSRRRIVGAQQIVARRGMIRALLVQRWIVPTRGFVPLLLGVAKQPFGPFLTFSTVAAAVWAVVFVIGSYLGGAKFVLAVPIVILTLTLALITGRLIARTRSNRARPRPSRPPL